MLVGDFVRDPQVRGEPLLDAKLRAVEVLGRHGIRVILVTTLHPGVNDHEMGAIVKYGLERPWVTGVSFQPATYSGRHVLPEDLDRRITFPDAYNFDVRRLLKCCTHHVLPSGHVTPFCAYNVLYRVGHVPLPTLTRHTTLPLVEPEQTLVAAQAEPV